MTDLKQLRQQVKEASYTLGLMDTRQKNTLLNKMATTIEVNTPRILQINALDLGQATAHGISKTVQDRLRLTEERITAMVEDIYQIATLPDPIGEVDKVWHNEAGLLIGQQRVPLGVIGIIYESWPNVTTDIASLCFESGNAIILRSGKKAFRSNQILVTILQEALIQEAVSPHLIQFVDDTSRKTAQQLMRLDNYSSVLVPRDGVDLIKTVLTTATVPAIETGTGNCHTYMDKDAQLTMTTEIIINAKCQRPSVCNTVETLLICQEVAEAFLLTIERALKEFHVELWVDERVLAILEEAILMTEQGWEIEFLDFILVAKIVDSLDEAIQHVDRYNTKHSESIISDNYFVIQQFLQRADAAVVYVNALTRFMDGFEFGSGAETGVSMQELHVRGPTGLAELTSTKYVIYEDGRTRS